MLTIIRGLPGSGKSTLAAQLPGLNFEADGWMKNEQGEYEFDPAKLKHCHEECKKHVRMALSNGCNVVVSNTFTQLWEMKPYIDMAKEFNTSFQIILCQGQFGSIHNVPIEKMQQMKERFEYDISDLL